jgi:hypothetical protein
MELPSSKTVSIAARAGSAIRAAVEASGYLVFILTA